MEEIRVEESNGIERKICICVPAQIVKERFRGFYSDLNKKVLVKGFRKGFTPQSILEAHYGKNARSAVSQSLFSEYYQRALKDHNIAPVAEPVVAQIDQETKTIGNFTLEDTYTVDVVVEVMPNVEVSNYNGMILKFPEGNKVEAVVAQKLAEAQDKFAERKGVDRPAQAGDCVVVEFTGTIEGKQIQGLCEESYTINKLGAGGTIAGFDDNVMGLSRDQHKQFSITFPDQHPSGLGGKTAEINLTVKNVVEVKPAAIDDELALMAGHNNLDEYQQALNTEAHVLVDRINRGNLELQVITQLSKQSKVEVPEGLVMKERDRILGELHSRGMAINDKVVANVEGSARYNIVRSILTDAIYNKEPALEITPDELDMALEKSAQEHQKPKDEFVSMLYNAKQMDAFMGSIRCKKVLDFIIAQAKPEESENKDAQEQKDLQHQG